MFFPALQTFVDVLPVGTFFWFGGWQISASPGEKTKPLSKKAIARAKAGLRSLSDQDLAMLQHLLSSIGSWYPGRASDSMEELWQALRKEITILLPKPPSLRRLAAYLLKIYQRLFAALGFRGKIERSSLRLNFPRFGVTLEFLVKKQAIEARYVRTHWDSIFKLRPTATFNVQGLGNPCFPWQLLGFVPVLPFGSAKKARGTSRPPARALSTEQRRFWRTSIFTQHVWTATIGEPPQIGVATQEETPEQLVTHFSWNAGSPSFFYVSFLEGFSPPISAVRHHLRTKRTVPPAAFEVLRPLLARLNNPPIYLIDADSIEVCTADRRYLHLSRNEDHGLPTLWSAAVSLGKLAGPASPRLPPPRPGSGGNPSSGRSDGYTLTQDVTLVELEAVIFGPRCCWHADGELTTYLVDVLSGARRTARPIRKVFFGADGKLLPWVKTDATILGLDHLLHKFEEATAQLEY